MPINVGRTTFDERVTIHKHLQASRFPEGTESRVIHCLKHCISTVYKNRFQMRTKFCDTLYHVACWHKSHTAEHDLTNALQSHLRCHYQHLRCHYHMLITVTLYKCYRILCHLPIHFVQMIMYVQIEADIKFLHIGSLSLEIIWLVDLLHKRHHRSFLTMI